jgi:Peptidase MA superfamily
MMRTLRTLGIAWAFSFLLSLTLVGSTATAFAQVNLPKPEQTTPVAAGKEAPAVELDAPHDAPRIPVDVVALPPLPADYVTEQVEDWLTVHYPKGTEVRLRETLNELPAFRRALAARLRQPILEKVELRVTRHASDMTSMVPTSIPPPAYAEAVAYSSLHLVLVALTAPITFEGVNVREALTHELSHVALYDATLGKPGPTWFNEGLAIHVSGEKAMARATTLGQAVATRSLIPLDKLDRNFPSDNSEVSVAYAQAGDFVRYMFRQGDEERFASLIARVRNGQPFRTAMTDAYGYDLRVLETQWREGLEKKFSYMPLLSISSALLGVVGAVSLLLAWRKKRLRNKKTVANWEQEERAILAFRLQREQELLALERQLGEVQDKGDGVMTTFVPTVEHDGERHVLH